MGGVGKVLFVFSLLIFAPDRGAAETIYLSCSLKTGYSPIMNDMPIPLSGSEAWTFETLNGRISRYWHPLTCIEEQAVLHETDTKISVECFERMEGKVFKHFAIIDRITGEYRSGFAVDGSPAYVAYGTCAVEKKLF